MSTDLAWSPNFEFSAEGISTVVWKAKALPLLWHDASVSHDLDDRTKIVGQIFATPLRGGVQKVEIVIIIPVEPDMVQFMSEYRLCMIIVTGTIECDWYSTEFMEFKLQGGTGFFSLGDTQWDLKDLARNKTPGRRRTVFTAGALMVRRAGPEFKPFIEFIIYYSSHTAMQSAVSVRLESSCYAYAVNISADPYTTVEQHTTTLQQTPEVDEPGWLVVDDSHENEQVAARGVLD